MQEKVKKMQEKVENIERVEIFFKKNRKMQTMQKKQQIWSQELLQPKKAITSNLYNLDGSNGMAL